MGHQTEGSGEGDLLVRKELPNRNRNTLFPNHLCLSHTGPIPEPVCLSSITYKIVMRLPTQPPSKPSGGPQHSSLGAIYLKIIRWDLLSGTGTIERKLSCRGSWMREEKASGALAEFLPLTGMEQFLLPSALPISHPRKLHFKSLSANSIYSWTLPAWSLQAQSVPVM